MYDFFFKYKHKLAFFLLLKLRKVTWWLSFFLFRSTLNFAQYVLFSVWKCSFLPFLCSFVQISLFIQSSYSILSNISFLCFCGCRIICSAKQTVSTNYWFKIFSKMFFVEIMKRTPDYRLDKIPLTVTQFTYKSR